MPCECSSNKGTRDPIPNPLFFCMEAGYQSPLPTLNLTIVFKSGFHSLRWEPGKHILNPFYGLKYPGLLIPL
jgi:hypothetical protein